MIPEYHGVMNVSDPATVLAGGLTMPILRALSHRASPVTSAQLRRAAAAGTEAGVRRALDRLARHGLITAEEIGDRIVYSLNREHILYPAVTALLRAGDELAHRLRAAILDWQVLPAAAALYGSAARRDGHEGSDIDLLVVRPAGMGSAERGLWIGQVHELRAAVERWTGNPCQVTDRSLTSLRRLSRAREPIVDEWRRDAVSLAGPRISELLEQL
jgi:DNA-binding transcriptional ArsR family regulator